MEGSFEDFVLDPKIAGERIRRVLTAGEAEIPRPFRAADVFMGSEQLAYERKRHSGECGAVMQLSGDLMPVIYRGKGFKIVEAAGLVCGQWKDSVVKNWRAVFAGQATSFLAEEDNPDRAGNKRLNELLLRWRSILTLLISGDSSNGVVVLDSDFLGGIDFPCDDELESYAQLYQRGILAYHEGAHLKRLIWLFRLKERMKEVAKDVYSAKSGLDDGGGLEVTLKIETSGARVDFVRTSDRF